MHLYYTSISPYWNYTLQIVYAVFQISIQIRYYNETTAV